MKVLFLKKSWVVEPLGIAYLAAVLKKNGHEVDLLKIDNNGFMKELKEFKPDILAYSICTGEHKRFLEINREIKKEYSAISIFGGSHPTYFPEMVYEKGVDIIIRGEAEKSFIELLKDIQIKHSCDGIVNFRTLEQNIDRILFPDREFLYKYSENRNNPIKNVITSRGCRFSCGYCFNSIYRDFYKGENWVRYRSPGNVVKECIELKKYSLKLIWFQDDEILTNPRLYELLDLYKKEVDVPFHCQIRIEFLTKDIAKKLKDAGCISVTFAIESGNDYIRQEILDRKITKSKILEGSDILHRVGLKFRTENMCGIPNESLSQMLETLDLNIQCKPAIAWASIFTPYPRLPLGEYAKKNGFWDGSFSSIKETFFEDTVLNTTIKKEIVNLQRLFGFIVGFPVLRKIVLWLLGLPKNKIYDFIHLKWKRNRYKVLYEC